MLTVHELDVYYGEAQALESVTLEVQRNEIVAVLGSNGAGKTTLVRSICGIQPTAGGSVTLDDRVISTLAPHKVVSEGVALVPEGRKLFTRMTVLENLELGAYSPKARSDFRDSLQSVYELFPLLAERSQQQAGTLSGGQQQMLAIGRALMAKPSFLLLDEPSLGLAPIIVDALFDLVVKIHESGVGILMVEQNVARTLDICQRGYVLDEGRVVMQGSRDELINSDRVRQAYLAL